MTIFKRSFQTQADLIFTIGVLLVSGPELRSGFGIPDVPTSGPDSESGPEVGGSCVPNPGLRSGDPGYQIRV